MLKLAFVIEAVDKATAKVRAVNRTIDKMTEPARRVRASFTSLIRESRFDRLQSAISGVGEKFGNLAGLARSAAGGLTAIAAAGAGVFYAVTRTAASMDQLVDTARLLKVPIERLQELQFTAVQNGGSAEGMADALRFLHKNMSAAIGGSKELVEWFGRVGISQERLRKMSAVEVYEQIAQKFHEVGDAGANASKKIEATTALMGRGGFEMVQMLNLGRGGLAASAEQARRSGAIVSAETAEALAEFNDTMNATRANLFATMAALSRVLLPVFQRIADAVSGWSKANRELIATKLGAFVDQVVQRLPGFMTAMGQIGGTLATLARMVNAVAQFLGGWQNVIKLVALALTYKLATALYGVAAAVWAVAGAFLLSPIGLIATGIAVAALLIFKYWEPIKGFFVGLWEGVKAAFNSAYEWIMGKVRAIVELATRVGRAIASVMPGLASDGQVSVDASGAALPSPFDVAPGTEVGGTIKIQIDQEGRARVREVTSTNRNVDLDVYSGLQMVAP